MTVTVNHAKTNAISDFTQAQLDEQIALGNFAPGTTLADIVLPSDWNDDHTLTGLGTMAEQNANSVAITGGSVNGTTIGATTASTGAFTTLSSNGTTSLTNGSANLTFTDGGGTVNPLYVIGQTTSLGRIRIHSQPQLRLTTNNNPIQFHTGAGTAAASDGNTQFVVSHTTSAVNHFQATGAATGNSPALSAQGSDANISTAILSKGTGAIDLAAGSSGVNISNGRTVTAITRTASGGSYTSIPTVAISAPTTAGGVQATASVASMAVGAVAIQSGGTGYAVSNVLTVAGGTGGNCTITVTTVSAGVITGISFTTTSPYTTLPTNPVSVTGGAGTGATFNLTYGISGVITITNAGSGYIEQPTITFSGGGGSGAAAYATVGSATVVRSIGTSMDFYTPNANIGMRVYDAGGTGTGYWRFAAGFVATATQIASSAGGNISTGGTGSLSMQTNSGSQTQLAVSHTASAVNHVQVTGGATGNGPTISAQGSDTNAFLAITSKGTSAIRLQTGGSTQVLINNTTSAINQLGLAGSTAGQACSIITQGTDTNIDLALTPKGTGNVRFGTHTATADVAISGYIEIKDSGGTLRKLAVIT